MLGAPRKNPVNDLTGFSFFGVADGARTHDNRNHNLNRQPSIHAGLRGVRRNTFANYTLISASFGRLYFHGKLSRSDEALTAQIAFEWFCPPALVYDLTAKAVRQDCNALLDFPKGLAYESHG